MLEYLIKEALTDYMRNSRRSKREAILKANEIIKKLARECQEEEKQEEVRA